MKTKSKSSIVTLFGLTSSGVMVEGGGKAKRWDRVATLPQVGCKTVKIGACGGKRARSGRKARIGLRAGRVTVLPTKPPASRGGYDDPMEVLAVIATETGSPPGREP